MIKQNAESLIEVSEEYNKLLKKKEVFEGQVTEEINSKILVIKNYVLKLCTDIQKLVTEEERSLES